MTKDQSILQAIILMLAQTIVLLAVSPFIVGLISKVKARLQCRQGASIFQPYADLRKLFRKQPVVSTTTSWIFTATPYIVFASTTDGGVVRAGLCLADAAQLCRQYYRLRLLARAGHVLSHSCGTRCRLLVRRDGEQP